MALPINIENTITSDKNLLAEQIKKYISIILKEYPRNGSFTT